MGAVKLPPPTIVTLDSHVKGILAPPRVSLTQPCAAACSPVKFAFLVLHPRCSVPIPFPCGSIPFPRASGLHGLALGAADRGAGFTFCLSNAP